MQIERNTNRVGLVVIKRRDARQRVDAFDNVLLGRVPLAGRLLLHVRDGDPVDRELVILAEEEDGAAVSVPQSCLAPLCATRHRLKSHNVKGYILVKRR